MVGNTNLLRSTYTFEWMSLVTEILDTVFASTKLFHHVGSFDLYQTKECSTETDFVLQTHPVTHANNMEHRNRVYVAWVWFQYKFKMTKTAWCNFHCACVIMAEWSSSNTSSPLTTINDCLRTCLINSSGLQSFSLYILPVAWLMLSTCLPTESAMFHSFVTSRWQTDVKSSRDELRRHLAIEMCELTFLFIM